MAKRAAKRKAKTRSGRGAAAKRPLPRMRAIEAALAGIAHDIRTPLTGIVALAELLASSDLGAREREWANAVKTGADHLALLTTLIVDAVRADAKGLVLRDEAFSPRALAKSVGQTLSARTQAKSIKTDIVIAPNVPDNVTGDALRLRAALENLADNAVKFTSDGAVTFTAEAAKAGRGRLRLTFTFTDSGIGMSPAEIKRLFRPFAQANEDIARRYGGAGLGLSFVRRIAKAMRGDLTVTSRPKQGSTFVLTALVTEVTTPAKNAAASTAMFRALKVLCAEDNPYGRVVMNTILTELGHSADFVESGEAAIKAVAAGSYDAVLMDVTLSGMDGLEATRRIRALPGDAGQVPVIGISGRGEAAHQSAALAAGMNFYFVKPVSPAKLAQALSSAALRCAERQRRGSA